MKSVVLDIRKYGRLWMSLNAHPFWPRNIICEKSNHEKNTIIFVLTVLPL